jgi:hypothetical protein
MDASKITQLRQKQANVYINRAKVTDSSTLTWQKQIESSKYVASQAPVSDLPGCLTCSSTSTVANGTAGVGPGAILLGMEGGQPIYELTPPPSKPSLFARGMGSAGRVYTSTNIMYQLAGQNSCGVATPYEGNLIQTLPRCFCSNQDIFYQNGTTLYVPPGADLSGNWLNPYLPIPQPYIQNTLACTVCGLYKVNLNNKAGTTYETATYVGSGPVVSTIQNGVVVYSTVAPKYDFIPNSNGVGGTQVQNGFTKPNAGDPRILP